MSTKYSPTGEAAHHVSVISDTVVRCPFAQPPLELGILELIPTLRIPKHTT